MPETTAEIITETVTQLEEREQRLQAIIEQAKPELAQIRTTLRALRKTSPNGRGPKPPKRPSPTDAVSAPVEVKDAILRELEASPGMQASPLAEAISADADSVRGALLDLQRTGDVESYSKGRWRIPE